MVNAKDLHMQETVKAAVEYVVSDGTLADLNKHFNLLCKDWHADEFDPDKLSFDVSDIAMCIEDEPWIRDIAAMPAHERTWQMTERVVEEFIVKYFAMRKEDVTSKNVADVLRVADPLSRRHILAQRVVIECIHNIKTENDLRHLDIVMDKLATNPRLEE